MELFLSCLPGLEPYLAAELRDLDLGEGEAQNGGVALAGDLATMMRANLQSGLCSHVYLRLDAFHARSLGEVVRKTARLPWGEWLQPKASLRVHAACHRSRLYHTGAVSQRVVEGISQALGSEPAAPVEGEPCPVVLARVDSDTLTLSLDTSGEPLHRRPWHVARGAAPLRADLARALVLASGWDRETPLVDPFCGSGTIAIEAAMLARRLPPAGDRSYAFEKTPLFDADVWGEVRAEAAAAALPASPAPLCAGDRDLQMVRRARDNAARAGVDADIRFVCASFSAAPWLNDPAAAPPAGAVASNPPFGRRLRGGDLRSLYQALGRRLRGLPPGWRVSLLGPDRRLVLATALDLRTALLAQHGGVRVRVLTGVTGG